MSFDSDTDKVKRFHHWMDRTHELIRFIVREYGYKYSAVYDLTHHLQGEYKTQGFSYETSYVIMAVTFLKFYNTLASESKNPESEFMKLPLEWKWNMCTELNEVEMEKALSAGKIVEDEFLKIDRGWYGR